MKKNKNSLISISFIGFGLDKTIPKSCFSNPTSIGFVQFGSVFSEFCSTHLVFAMVTTLSLSPSLSIGGGVHIKASSRLAKSNKKALRKEKVNKDKIPKKPNNPFQDIIFLDSANHDH